MAIHILQGGPVRRLKDKNGRIWTFEMHPYCGPSAVDPNTEIPWVKQPSEKSPFWPAVHAWISQGQHVDAYGLCIWSPTAEPDLVHLGGRNYAYAGSKLAQRVQAQEGQQ
jgi:hypothetical protein